jgi:ATP-dependent exoDNAse (exonuclease V) alpha subunit
LRHGRGHLQLEELKTAALREESRGLVLKAGNEVATQESLAREREMIQTIHRGQGQFPRLGGTEEFVVSDRLRPEQKHAVQVVLDSRDLAVNLRGAAGTGKTATLQEIQRGVAEGGREIVAVAPTRSAVEELEKLGFSHALTMERLLQDQKERQQLAGKVLIVDEAGMVSSRQMSELLKLAERSRTQILFSGDTRQIQSVEAGDALRVLEQESRLKSVSLRQVQRQTLAEYRKAVEELRQNPARGFRQLEQMGAVREVEWLLRPQEVSQAYREAIVQPNAKGQTREVLVVAPTHEEIRRLTEAIRSDRQSAGELGPSEPLTRHVPFALDASAKAGDPELPGRDGARFSQGDQKCAEE